MSRIGNSAIVIPADVTLSQQNGMIVAKGKNGELSAPLQTFDATRVRLLTPSNDPVIQWHSLFNLPKTLLTAGYTDLL